MDYRKQIQERCNTADGENNLNTSGLKDQKKI